MVKRFSPREGHPERFTELHEEEEREEGDRDEQEDKMGTQEERDRSMQLSVPKVFSVAQTPRDSQNWTGKRRGKEVF